MLISYQVNRIVFDAPSCHEARIASPAPEATYANLNKWHACPGSYNKTLARRGGGKRGGAWEKDERGVMGGLWVRIATCIFVVSFLSFVIQDYYVNHFTESYSFNACWALLSGMF